EEPPGERVPERRMAALLDDPAELGDRSVAEAASVLPDEQITAAREQKPPPAGAHVWVEEQAADFRRAFEVGRQAQLAVVDGLAELRAPLRQGADVIAVESLRDPDLAEYLAG